MTRWPKLVDFELLREAPAQRLAGLRVLVGGFAVVYLLIRLPHLAGLARLSATNFAPVGPVTLLVTPLSPAVHLAVLATTILAGFAFVLGWRHRLTGPLFSMTLLWMLSYRSSWGMVFHTENLLVLHVLVLGMSAAADAWSLDARRSGSLPRADRYAWPIRLMAFSTVATYFIAGVAKLRSAGLDWVTGEVLRNQVAWDNLRKIELGDAHSLLGAALVEHPWVFPPLAALSLVVELGAPLALLGRRIAATWAALAWGFHAGVLAIMAVLFPYPLVGIAFAPLFCVDSLIVRLRALVLARSSQ